MLTAATPSTGWLLGYDVDGFLKQKNAEGVITQVGLGGTASIPPTPTLSEVLEMSNLTGTYSIVMGTQTIISTVNGDSYLSLDPGGNPGTAQLWTTDGTNENAFVLVSGQSRIVSTDGTNLSRIYLENSVITQTVNDGVFYFQNTATASYYSLSLINPAIFTSTINFLEAGSTYDSGTAYKVFLHLNSPYSTTNVGVKNSAIIGGSYVTAEEDETVYLPQVVIRSGDKIKGAGGASLNFEESGDVILAINNPFVTNSIIGIFSSTSSSVHLSNKNGVLVRDTSTFSYSPSAQSPVTFISTEFSYVDSGVYNTVIIGGNNLTATQSDTVYLGNKVNINNSYYLPDTDGSSAEALLTDGSGNLYWGTMPAAQVSTFSLYQILNQSNDTVNQNIMMGTATFLFSSNTGGRIYLDKSGVAGNVFISTNNTSISDTYIDMSQTDLSIYTPGVYNMSFDSSSIASGNLEGLVYGFDYSATFVTYSLVDKNYVDTLFTTSSPTFNNGLIEITSGVIGLGGTLSMPTVIQNDGYNFSIQGNGSIYIQASYSSIQSYNLDGYTEIQSAGDYTNMYYQSVTNSNTYNLQLNTNGFSLVLDNGFTQSNYLNIYSYNEISGDGSDNNRMVIMDEQNQKGLVYYNDYTAQFTTHSLVSKGYADSILARVENGLTQSLSGNVGLGGQLNQQIIIDGNGQELQISGIDRILFTASTYIDSKAIYDGYYSQRYLDSSSNYLINSDIDGYTYSGIWVYYNSISLESYESIGSSVAISLYNQDQTINDGSEDNRLLVTDKVHGKGLVYPEDYSANFTTYSLVTKGYVDTRPISVNNGLTQSSGIIGLGGILSNDVVVKGNQWSLAFDDMARIRFTASTYIDMRVLGHTYTNWSLSSGSNYYNKIFDNTDTHHYSGFFIDGSTFNSSLSTSYDSGTYSTISVGDDGAFLEVGNGLGTYAGIYTYNYSEQSYDGTTDNTFIVRDDFNNKGLVYLDDYTGQFTTHSLVSKGYVDKAIDTSKPYKIYAALLSQSGTASPTATVLENTFGVAATFSYMTAGYYQLHMSGQFTSKTFVINGSPDQGPIGGDFAHFTSNKFDSSTILLRTMDVNGSGSMDGLLNLTSIEIRVYV